jgi:hypothetical protein
MKCAGLADARACRFRVSQRLECIPIRWNRDALQILLFCAWPCRKTGVHFSGTCTS